MLREMNNFTMSLVRALANYHSPRKSRLPAGEKRSRMTGARDRLVRNDNAVSSHFWVNQSTMTLNLVLFHVLNSQFSTSVVTLATFEPQMLKINNSMFLVQMCLLWLTPILGLVTSITFDFKVLEVHDSNNCNPLQVGQDNY